MFLRVVGWVVATGLGWSGALAQQEGEAAGASLRKGRKAAKLKLPTVSPHAELNRPMVHEDFPAMCLNEEGKPVLVYIEHDGQKDVLKLATLSPKGELVEQAVVSGEGMDNIHQPTLTMLSNGRLICVWSQLEVDGQWDLMARTIGRRGLAALGKPVRLTQHRGNDLFPDIGLDRGGRVWLAWQRLHEGANQVLAMHLEDPEGEWSEEIVVTTGEGGGDWEPRLAFGADDDALVVFDGYRRGDFDVYLTRVAPDGRVGEALPLAATDRYEARAEAAVTRDGKTLWVTYENGIERWGKDLGVEWRSKGGGLHHDRLIKVVKVDLGTNAIEEVADVTDLLPDLVADPQSVGTGAIDVPEIILDAEDRPWVFFRYCLFNSPGYWQIAFTRLDPATGEWSKPEALGKSALCLDRRVSVSLSPKDGSLHVGYPGDLRKNKQAGDTGIYLATIDPGAQRMSAGKLPFNPVQEAPSLLKAYNDTPERVRSEHHRWEVDGETYTLFWGDVHRHTDFSNCRTTDDGCIVEHYRYAIEAGGLDFLGTSDHTEVGKTLSPYEWWQTQKLADLFHNPGSFVSLYAYEREQKYPYGHRNVLFLERGGPVVYIKRKNYLNSPWATSLPPPEGAIMGDIPPWQLWGLLRAHGKRAVTIPHTTAGRMGTDWAVYQTLDPEFENVIELFQGSRNSSEGQGAPQPAVVVGRPEVSNFKGNDAKGTWQEALRQQHRLGAFASSDHRSTNLSYGGVYVKELTREAILDALDARRTVAATDKIFMEFSCNGRPLGEVFVSDKQPSFRMNVVGTSPIRRVTLVRNEKDYKVYEPVTEAPSFAETFVDEAPVSGENRYYLRVEQSDGNMGWTSPVWVTVE